MGWPSWGHHLDGGLECLCVFVRVCVSPQETPGCSPIIPPMKWHPLDPQHFTVYKKFYSVYTGPYLILPPTQEAGNTNCVMPILWMVIYSGEIDLPKMPSVVELANPSAWLFHYTTGIESFNELFTEHLACVSHCARTYSSACSPERNFFKSPTSHPPPHAINDEF